VAKYESVDSHSKFEMTHNNPDVLFGRAPWIEGLIRVTHQAHDVAHCTSISFLSVGGVWEFMVNFTDGTKGFTADHDLSDANFIVTNGSVINLRISEIEAYQAVRAYMVNLVQNQQVTKLEFTYFS
jgi:hypothetical protein